MMRIEYLNSLPYFQDIFLEFQIAESNCFLITENHITIGYLIVNPENVLLEFYLKSEHVVNGKHYLQQAIDELNITEIYCKSFDGLLLSLCLELQFKHQPIGRLFRDFIPVEHQPNIEITSRYASEEDLSFLKKQDDEVFEPKDMLEEFIANKNILLFEKDAQIVGCGFITTIHPRYKYKDLGMWVHPGFRQQGIASHIMMHLLAECKKNQWQAVLGCDISNTNSQKTLRKCGLISKHLLLSFQVSPKLH